MPAAKTITQKDITSESTQLSASTAVDSGLLEAITDSDNGFMRGGAMPAVETISAAGSKALLDAMGKACAKQNVLFISHTHTRFHMSLKSPKLVVLLKCSDGPCSPGGGEEESAQA